MDQLYVLIWGITVTIGVVAVIIARQWIYEYNPPSWRRESWGTPGITYDPRWTPWFAWRPVRTISGNVLWWQTVYRSPGNTYADYEDWRWYHYGDAFDILRNSE